MAQATDASTRPQAAESVSDLGDPTSPDIPTAAVQAKALGHRVEVTSLRTADTSTFIEPDGARTISTYSDVVHVQQDGDWIPVDTSLHLVDGSLRPVATAADVAFSDGGADTPLAQISDQSHSLDLDWSTTLPTPSIDGNTATYADVQPGVNLQVTALTSGFEQSVVLTKRPTEPLTFTLPIESTHLTAQDSQGGVDFTDSGTGKPVIDGGAAVMFDSASKPHVADLGDTATDTSGQLSIKLAPDSSFLSDPNTVYPVVLDPSSQLLATQHTYTSSANPTTSYSTSGTLYAGTDAGGNLRRTFLAFNVAPLDYGTVSSAKLYVHIQGQNDSSKTTDLLISNLFSGSTTWNSNVGWGTGYGTVNGTGTGGWQAFDIGTSGLMQAWADSGQTTGYVQLHAHSETDSTYTKWYDSGSDGTHQPHIDVTYDAAPTLTSLSVSPFNTDGSGYNWTSGTPVASVIASDADNQSLSVTWNAYNVDNGTQVATSTQTNVASGSTVQWTPTSLFRTVNYEITADATDSTGHGASEQVSPVFELDPYGPTLGTPTATGFALNTWSTATSGSITMSTTNANLHDPDVASYSWWLDDDDQHSTIAPTATAGGTLATASGIAPSGAGWHIFHYQVTDNVGNVTSSQVGFGVGTGGLILPTVDGTRTQAAAVLQGSTNNGAASSADYEYRIGQAGSFTQIPSSNVTFTGGDSWPLIVAGGHIDPVTWNIAGTLGAAGKDQQIQVTVCFFSSGTSLGCAPPRTVFFARHAFGAAYATQKIGPGAVSLLTGDFATDATDVSLPTYSGSLSVGRSDSSFRLPVQGAQMLNSDQITGTGDSRSFCPDSNLSQTAGEHFTFLGSGSAVTGTWFFGDGISCNHVSAHLVPGHTYELRMKFTITAPSAAFPTFNYDPSKWYGQLVGSSYTIKSPPLPQNGTLNWTFTVPTSGNGAGYPKLSFVGTAPAGFSYDNPDTTPGNSVTDLGVLQTPFGYGWNASLDGPAAGVAGEQVDDQSASGYLGLVMSDGGEEFFLHDASGTGDGTYHPVGNDAPSGDVVTKTGTSVVHYDGNGTTTTFAVSGGVSQVASVVEPSNGSSSNLTTTYHYDGSGRVDEILAPVPPASPAITCTLTGTPTGLSKGCRAITISYGSTTTATGDSTSPSTWGDYIGAISQIAFTAYDPVTSAMSTDVVSQYSYDFDGHLRAQWDPRVSPALKTTYSYTDSTPQGLLSSVTPPGLNGYSMTYDGSNRLSQVTRQLPAGSSPAAQTTTIAYQDYLLASGLPDLSNVAAWGQTDDKPNTGTAATGGSFVTAVFPPTHIPTMSGASAQPVSSDYPYASFTYLDASGRTVDTASYGIANGTAGWQIAASQHDDFGNVIWSLSPRARAEVVSPDGQTDVLAASLSPTLRANLLATTDTYNTDSTDPTNSGTELVSSYGPIQLAVRSDGGGSVQEVRLHTITAFDEGAPNSGKDPHGQRYRLPTTQTTLLCTVDNAGNCTDTTNSADIRQTVTSYGVVSGGACTTGEIGGVCGWNLRLPTRVTSRVDGIAADDLVSDTAYDDLGHTTETRKPKDPDQTATADTSAYSTITAYYVADSNGTTGCTSKPEYAGLPCTSGPAGQPTGAPASRPYLPITTYQTYNRLYQPTSILDQVPSGATGSRTTTTNYDAAGRVTDTGAYSGNTSSVTMTRQYMQYSAVTGLHVCTSNGALDGSGNCTGNQVLTTYDVDGRTIGTTDGDGNSTTYTLDADDRVVSQADNKGTDSYTYDGGNEHRGLITAVAGTTGAYDANGTLVSSTRAGITSANSFNDAGNLTKRVVTFVGGGTWTWAQTPNAFSGVAKSSSPFHYSSQVYAYDRSSRLSSVADTAADVDAAGYTTTRHYAYDRDSNRTGESVDQNYHTQVLSNSPVAYWRLGETSGTTITDATGHANGTYPGTGFTLNAGGGGGGATPGDTNNYISFDGSTESSMTANTYVTLGDSFTLEFWVKSTSLPTANRVILRKSYAATASDGYEVKGGTDGAVHLYIGGQEAKTNAILGDSKFHHVVYSYDGTSLVTYQDGKQVQSLTVSLAGDTSSDGLHLGGGGGPWTVSLDELAEYHTPLSLSAIDDHDAAALAGTWAQVHSYDEADRMTDSGYSYDALGRTLTLPARTGTAGVTLTYYANDLVASEAQGTVTKTFGLDPLYRVTTTATTGATTTTQHYDSTAGQGSESASWIDNGDGTWDRNVASLGGGLVSLVNSAGVATVMITNPHGDVVGSAPATTGLPSSYTEDTEFGSPRPSTINVTTPADTAGPTRDDYGYLGSDHRNHDGLGNLIQMGERLYSPLLGRFLQPDPVPGGSCNDYDYTCQDPISGRDPNGQALTVPDSGGNASVPGPFTYHRPPRPLVLKPCGTFGCPKPPPAKITHSGMPVAPKPKPKPAYKEPQPGDIFTVIGAGIKYATYNWDTVVYCAGGVPSGAAAGGALGGPGGAAAGALAGCALGATTYNENQGGAP